MKKLNKKGAEMTIGTIVIIVLALIVLVVLIVGFTGGWGNLWGRISSFFGGENVDSIVSACNVACSTNAKYDYCERTRDLKVKEGGTMTTRQVKCVDLVNEKYGLKRCDSITCGETTKPQCTGTATECTNLAEAKCKAQEGCTWITETAKCEGTARACTELDANKCDTQEGCSLE